MVWDDHDMSDDWNISASWLEEMRQKSWWHRRATSGLMSYWVYQHIGNLSPQVLDEDDLYRRVRGNVHATRSCASSRPTPRRPGPAPAGASAATSAARA